MAARRINKELTAWIHGKGIKASPLVDDDLWEWQVVIYGPEDSLYEGGIYYYKITLPKDYPFKPPEVTKLTPWLHVNNHPTAGCNTDCHICLPEPIGAVGKCGMNSWSPGRKIYDVMQAIRHAMKNPNFDKPGDTELAALYQRDKDAYARKIQRHVVKHAIHDCHR